MRRGTCWQGARMSIWRTAARLPVWVKLPVIIALVLAGVALSPMLLGAAGIDGGGGHGGSGDMQMGEEGHGSGDGSQDGGEHGSRDGTQSRGGHESGGSAEGGGGHGSGDDAERPDH